MHQAITHRRDSAINARLKNKAKPLDIREDGLEALRYGPFVYEKFMFNPNLLKKIAKEREAITDKRLSAAALSFIASSVHRSEPTVAAKPSKRTPMATAATPAAEASSKKAKTERVVKPVQLKQSVPSEKPASTTPYR